MIVPLRETAVVVDGESEFIIAEPVNPDSREKDYSKRRQPLGA